MELEEHAEKPKELGKEARSVKMHTFPATRPLSFFHLSLLFDCLLAKALGVYGQPKTAASHFLLFGEKITIASVYSYSGR